MSSPPAGNGSGVPGPDWYPDPSIPGYIRYWDGAAWVPGSSRPEPRDGEPKPAPPPGVTPQAPASAAPALPSPRQEAAPSSEGTAESSGDSTDGSGTAAPEAGDAARTDTTESAATSQDAEDTRDAGNQTGNQTGNDTGNDAGNHAENDAADGGPTVPALRQRGDVTPARGEPAGPAWPAGARGTGHSGRDKRVTWGSDEDVSTSPVAAAGRVDPRGQFRRPPTESSAPPARPAPKPEPAPAAPPAEPESPAPDTRDQTVGLRRADIPAAPPSWTQQVRELAQQQPGAPEREAAPPAAPASPALPPAQPAQSAQPVVPPQAPAPQPVPPQAPAPQPVPPQVQQQPAALPPSSPAQGAPVQPAPAPQGGYGYPAPLHQRPTAPVPEPAPTPAVAQPAPADSPFVQPDMLTAQIAPRRPFSEIERQAYPAGLGRRLVARLLDSLLPVGGAVAVAVPLVSKARDHIQEQIDAAEIAGVTRDVWLIDGTTGGYLAMVLGVFFGAGLLLEALPTAIWGRSLGKAVCGLRVLHVERQDKPGFGAALVRWLLYSVLAVLVVGVVNVLWCLRDRPWRQCWHDKAVNTFVAKRR